MMIKVVWIEDSKDSLFMGNVTAIHSNQVDLAFVIKTTLKSGRIKINDEHMIELQREWHVTGLQ